MIISGIWTESLTFGIWIFGSLAMELGNLEGDLGTVELGVDIQEGVLGSSTVR